jgi:protein-S-isoprenylcysteine O-methyltransferase Ste14
MERILAWLPLVTLIVMMNISRLRALMLRRRGVRAIIVDWKRPTRQLLYDALIIGVFWIWFLLLLADAFPFSLAWMPDWLTKKLIDNRPAKFAGAALIITAPILFVAALRSMGMSWRIGIDQQKAGPLITAGLFAWTRNPIYTAFYLLIVGAFFIHGRVVFLLLGAVLVLLVHGIVRREERFLDELFRDEFHDYRARVGRYSPWF